ncbi:cytochrome C oxidase subunit IV family protein [Aliibacillus thermotolerans]|uniref:Cytochrome C oxidase subunit IV family protein n=1 Tax=Aliibacillus thermotolerans TaxID=1834418 RepID=A0ABW0U3W0_9BACI|nr:cytochrome C oxidase subunit IV family protein [Aliibacillus thermotolerans]MDA3131043.1 cytochrome-c oxidase [Aliibacillus thermotolerans]
MAEELSKPFDKSAMTLQERAEHSKETRIQIISFAFMIGLTVLSFLAVGTEVLATGFVVPFILLLGVIQFFLQLFYFMHLKDKDHGWPNMLFSSGLVLSAPVVISLILLLGIVKW